MSGGLYDPSPSVDEYPVPADYQPLDRDEETAIVRPYALTGGRTKANYVLELETLVSTKDSAAERSVSQAAASRSWKNAGIRGRSPKSRRFCGCRSEWHGY
jgi:hypothetical protein